MRSIAPQEKLSLALPKLEVLALFTATAGIQLLLTSLLPSAAYLDLPLIVVIYISWYSAPFKGAACGMIFGLLQDLISGIYLGLNGLSKTMFGFAVAYLSTWIFCERFFQRLLVIAVLSLLDNTVVFGLLALLKQPLVEWLWAHVLIKALVTGVGGGFFFRAADRIKFPPKDFRRLE